MPDHRVVLIQLVEFSFLKEEDGIVVVLLDLPELVLERGEAVPG